MLSNVVIKSRGMRSALLVLDLPPHPALLRYDDRNCLYLRCTTWCFGVHIHCEIITTISLINISTTAYSYIFFFFVFYFCVVRTLKTYVVSKFKVCNSIVNYNYIAVHLISRIYLGFSLFWLCVSGLWNFQVLFISFLTPLRCDRMAGGGCSWVFRFP